LARAGGASTPENSASPPPNDSKSNVPTQADLEQHLQIEVTINGKGPYHFVVDTGADRTVIASDIAAALALPGKQSEVMVEGIVTTVPAGTVHVESLEFGPVRREDLELPILPRALLAADGYLGLDVIRRYSVTFDFANTLLRIGPSRTSNLPGTLAQRSARVSLQGEYGHLRAIDCSVDDVAASAFIDSGAQVTIGNPRLGASLANKGFGHRETGIIPLTGVTGGLAEGRVMTIESVRLENLTFSIPAIVIADLQIFDTWGLRETPALLMGMNYLQRFARVTVDYGAKELRFNLAGVALARRERG
jgi:predicted aspartyl protease